MERKKSQAFYVLNTPTRLASPCRLKLVMSVLCFLYFGFMYVLLTYLGNFMHIIFSCVE